MTAGELFHKLEKLRVDPEEELRVDPHPDMTDQTEQEFKLERLWDEDGNPFVCLHMRNT